MRRLLALYILTLIPVSFFGAVYMLGGLTLVLVTVAALVAVTVVAGLMFWSVDQLI